MNRFWWCPNSLLVQKRSKRSFDEIWSRSVSRAQNHVDAGWKMVILAREFRFRRSERIFLAIMYILTSGFMGFTKYSQSSELFGAQNCNRIRKFYPDHFDGFSVLGGENRSNHYENEIFWQSCISWHQVFRDLQNIHGALSSLVHKTVTRSDTFRHYFLESTFQKCSEWRVRA